MHLHPLQLHLLLLLLLLLEPQVPCSPDMKYGMLASKSCRSSRALSMKNMVSSSPNSIHL